MSRHLLIAMLLAATLGPATSATAAERCQRRPGEHQLARSAQAVVFERTAVPPRRKAWVQTITGCSRSTGRRRTIAKFDEPTAGTRAQLVELRLAGTRVAYVSTLATKYHTGGTFVVADDAVHGGRQHGLSSRWPYSADPFTDVTAWVVDADGDVAWVSAPRDGPRSLVLWRPGGGLRQIDTGAELDGITLSGGTLSWRHNGTPRTLAVALPPSACGPHRSNTVGTTELDVSYNLVSHYLDSYTMCLRATGQTVTVSARGFLFSGPLDVAGPYVIFTQGAGILLVDLLAGAITSIPANVQGIDVVVNDHGSLAWIDHGGQAPALWVRDAAGTRQIPGAGVGHLFRDGSTVTWPGGPVVTLSP